MVTNSLEREISSRFFLFLVKGGWGRGIFYFSALFSMCSHHVPKGLSSSQGVLKSILQDTPNVAPHIYPIWFAQLSCI
jgi:hypothetical protein